MVVKDWIGSPIEWGQFGTEVNGWMGALVDSLRRLEVPEDSSLYVSEGTAQTNLSNLYTAPVAGSPTISGTFTAPKSGKVLLALSLWASDNGGSNLITFDVEVREDDASGTIVNPLNDANVYVALQGQNLALHPALSRVSQLTGLTPGQLYYVQGYHWVSGGTTADIYLRQISVNPLPEGQSTVSGGGTPPATHTVAFRSIVDPAVKTPAVTPSATAIEHASGGTIYAGGSGTTHTITTAAQWTTAVAAAAPGDILDITAPITTPLTYRGNKYGLSGGSAASGTAGNPIVIRCSGSGAINVASLTNSTAALNVTNCDHVWAVGVVTTGSQFGVFYRNVEGTTGDPIRVAHCNISGAGHSTLSIAGWWQLITSSGGTPPAGSGNEWGYSKHFVIEDNVIASPGQSSAQFGECVYLGHGGAPGWISRAENVTVRHNALSDCGADYIDIKPGCSTIRILDNTMTQGHFVYGAAIQTLYVNAATAARPAWYDIDPDIVIEGNRIWDGNITNYDAASSNYVVQASLAGVTFANNICWGFPNGGIGFRLRSERAASESQSSAGEKWVIVNNLFWMDNGLANAGAPLSSPSPFNSAWIDSRNNIGPTGATGVQATATSADFIDSAAIPTVDTIDADAEWVTYGQGSAFDLDLASTLIGTGVSISDITLLLSEDVSQRAIPASSPDPGPFQHWV